MAINEVYAKVKQATVTHSTMKLCKIKQRNATCAEAEQLSDLINSNCGRCFYMLP